MKCQRKIFANGKLVYYQMPKRYTFIGIILCIDIKPWEMFWNHQDKTVSLLIGYPKSFFLTVCEKKILCMSKSN